VWRILIPHEDKVDVFHPKQHIVQRGWRMLIPDEDIKVDVFHPKQHIVHRVGEFDPS